MIKRTLKDAIDNRIVVEVSRKDAHKHTVKYTPEGSRRGITYEVEATDQFEAMALASGNLTAVGFENGERFADEANDEFTIVLRRRGDYGASFTLQEWEDGVLEHNSLVWFSEEQLQAFAEVVARVAAGGDE